jgi:hypothetical protein
MQSIRTLPSSTTEQSSAEKLRSEARRFVGALTGRLEELEKLAQLARRFNVFSAEQYAEFKQLFLNFRDLCEEFQVLSRLAESSLAHLDSHDLQSQSELIELDTTFRALQVPMLRAMIRTNLRLLRVWDDRLRSGAGMPYGSRELFRETVRIVDTARDELLRPRHLALLEEESVQEAEEAEKLLKSLIAQSPSLFDFVESEAIDDELLRLINGFPQSPL